MDPMGFLKRVMNCIDDSFFLMAVISHIGGITLPETKIAHEKWWLEDYFFLGTPIFRFYVIFSEGND